MLLGEVGTIPGQLSSSGTGKGLAGPTKPIATVHPVQARMLQVINRINDLALLRLLVLSNSPTKLDPRNIVAVQRAILRLYRTRGAKVLKVGRACRVVWQHCVVQWWCFWDAN